MSVFERYLTLWVALCIIAGVVLGQLFPGLFQAVGSVEIAKVNLPVAGLIWLMIIPMLVKIDFAALARVKEHWRGIGVTLFINWAVKPFSMALLGWLFIGWLFRPYLPTEQVNSYIAGLILLAAAPCTAMVFVWSHLSDGEPHFTLSQVALNDVIMVFAFAPIVGLLLGLSAITVPWQTLLLSVGLYIVVPVVIAQIVRQSTLAQGGADGLKRLLAFLQPASLAALLLTLVLTLDHKAFWGYQTGALLVLCPVQHRIADKLDQVRGGLELGEEDDKPCPVSVGTFQVPRIEPHGMVGLAVADDRDSGEIDRVHHSY